MINNLFYGLYARARVFALELSRVSFPLVKNQFDIGGAEDREGDTRESARLRVGR